jgi:hypothetical protein
MGWGGIVLTAQGTRSHSSTAKGTTQGIWSHSSSAQRENFHQIEWDKKQGFLKKKMEPFWHKIRVMKPYMNETSSHQSLKAKMWQTLSNWWWWEERFCGQFSFACSFLCFLQIMGDGVVMVISGFDGVQHLELSCYSWCLICVSRHCIVVWRMRIMEWRK